MKFATQFLIGLLATGVVFGASPDNVVSPAELRYQEGYRLLKTAEHGATAGDRIAGLQAAAKELRAAIASQPDHYLARSLLAQTLFGLTRELTDAGERRQAASEAREQFAAAAKLPEADWRIFNAWGRFLIFSAQDSKERRATLTEAQSVFEKALGRARWRTEKSAVNHLYGQCLYQLATLAGTSEEKRRYLTGSIERLTSATQGLPMANDIVALRTLGDARLELGQMEHNAEMIRQAVAPLQEALASSPNNPETHYSLARAYALLGDADQALSQLRSTVESGSATNLAILAPNDSAFATLRGRQDFQQALTSDKDLRAANALLREGLHNLEKAEAATSPAVRVELLKQAVESFRRAAKLQPDSAAIHSLWAQALTRLTQNVTAQDERRALATEALAQFSAAAATTNADWQTYYSWGALLQSLATGLPSGNASRLDRLREASEKFEDGLKRTRLSDERRLLQRELAASLLARVLESPASAGRTALLNRCLKVCAEQPAADDSRAFGIWGRALILSAQVDGDRKRLREAAEKLATALKLDGENSEWQYRLATAYALLDNKEQALLHLRPCLENDPTGSYHRLAAQDVDLDRLRTVPEFYQLLGAQGQSSDDILSRPVVPAAR